MVDGRRPDRRRASWPGELLAWEDDMRARGSLDLLGPSTKRALAALLAGASLGRGGPQRHHQRRGDADRPGRHRRAGRGPGPAGRPGGEASRVTHNTGVALAGAAAVAAAVSAGVGGATVPRGRSGAAVAAARAAAGRGHWVAAADVAARITWAAGLIAGRPAGEALTLIVHAGRHQPGHPGVGARRVRRARRLPGRPVAGLPAGRVGWAATPTPSPRWPARSAAPATGRRRSRSGPAAP